MMNAEYSSFFILPSSLVMLPTTRSLLLLLITAPLMALGAWLPFMEWVAWGYAIFVLAMIIHGLATGRGYQAVRVDSSA
ncbi:MAG: hypothetical protein QM730_12135 [Anaerolineales bacterium]